ncbi:MAG: 6-carboxytetrahydropterin synthase [Bacteroidales bacterium]|nr:6-carboxytetrahydropterin synthase [Bacteroidales bacterium]
MTLRLTKQFSFEMAHALPAYEGKCHNIHGHSYKLFVTVEGAPLSQIGAPTDGMVLDFHTLKECVEKHIVDRFDHALVLPQKNVGSDTNPDTGLGGYAAKLIFVDFQPTTENLLLHFARLLDGQFPPGVRLYSLKLYETETSCAELIL